MITILVLWNCFWGYFFPRSRTWSFGHEEKEIEDHAIGQQLQHQCGRSRKSLRCHGDAWRISGVEDRLKALPVELGHLASFVRNSSDVRSQDETGSTTSLQKCISGFHGQWLWLSTLLDCGNVHLEDASRYHQYYHLVKEYRCWMENDARKLELLLRWLAEDEGGSVVRIYTDGSLQAILGSAHRWKNRILDLHERSKMIVPLHLRTQRLDFHPVHVEILTDFFTDDENRLTKGEVMRLEDNSDQDNWKVRMGEKDIRLPSAILRINAPDISAIEASLRLASRFADFWTTHFAELYQLLRNNIVNLLRKDLADKKLSPEEKLEVLRRINMMKVLLASGIEDSNETSYKEFQSILNELEQSLNKLADDPSLSKEDRRDSEMLSRIAEREMLTNRFKEFYDQSKILLNEIDVWCRLNEVSISKAVMSSSSDRRVISRERSFSDEWMRNKSSGRPSFDQPDDGKTGNEENNGGTILDFSKDFPRDGTTLNGKDGKTEKKENSFVGISDLSTDFRKDGVSADRKTEIEEEEEEMMIKAVGVPDLSKDFRRDGGGVSIERKTETQEEIPDLSTDFQKDGAELDGKIDDEIGKIKNIDIGGYSKDERDVAASGKKEKNEEIEAVETTTSDFSNDFQRDVASSSSDGRVEEILIKSSRGEELSASPEHFLSTVRDVKMKKVHEQRRSETVRVTRTEQEESFTYVITGVTNPKSGARVSLVEAVQLGIVNQKEGIYIDDTSRTVMPIQKAMNEGLIQVERVSNTRIAEKKSSIFIITIRTERETRPYRITGVIDAETEKRFTVDEAEKAGIFDQNQSLYRNRATGEDLSLDDAFDSGLLVVEFDDGEGETCDPVIDTKTYAVEFVVDVKTRARLSFADAVLRGLVDDENGEFVNSLTSERTDVGTAIREGYIRATILKDPSSYDDIPPENRVVFQPMMKRVLGKVRMIAALTKKSPSRDARVEDANGGGGGGGGKVAADAITDGGVGVGVGCSTETLPVASAEKEKGDSGEADDGIATSKKGTPSSVAVDTNEMKEDSETRIVNSSSSDDTRQQAPASDRSRDDVMYDVTNVTSAVQARQGQSRLTKPNDNNNNYNNIPFYLQVPKHDTINTASDRLNNQMRLSLQTGKYPTSEKSSIARDRSRLPFDRDDGSGETFSWTGFSVVLRRICDKLASTTAVRRRGGNTSTSPPSSSERTKENEAREMSKWSGSSSIRVDDLDGGCRIDDDRAESASDINENHAFGTKCAVANAEFFARLDLQPSVGAEKAVWRTIRLPLGFACFVAFVGVLLIKLKR